MDDQSRAPGFSQDAAIVLALADTAVPFAHSPEDEAERWVRVMRMHGQVGATLQSMGVGEAPLETPAQSASVRLLRRRPLGEDVVEMVTEKAREFAIGRASGTVCTIDVLFGLFAVYGKVIDRALYIRGATRDELLERLAAGAEAGVAAG